MYKNKTESGRNNICGLQIKQLRIQMKDKPSQRRFSELLQIAGLDVDKNAVSRMESGERFITDIELKIIAQVLGVTYEALLDG